MRDDRLIRLIPIFLGLFVVIVVGSVLRIHGTAHSVLMALAVGIALWFWCSLWPRFLNAQDAIFLLPPVAWTLIVAALGSIDSFPSPLRIVIQTVLIFPAIILFTLWVKDIGDALDLNDQENQERIAQKGRQTEREERRGKEPLAAEPCRPIGQGLPGTFVGNRFAHRTD